jgi:hypothetical protein
VLTVYMTDNGGWDGTGLQRNEGFAMPTFATALAA